MTDKNKPVPKRHLGPAMQWAKPRSNLGRLDGGSNRKIELDFADQAVDEDPKASSGQERTDQLQSGSWTPSADRESGSRRTTTESSQAEDREGASWWQRLPEGAAAEASAWNYYAGTGGNERQDTVEGRDSRFNYTSADTRLDPELDDPYFGEMYPPETPQYNSSAWDQTMRQEPNETSWLQYILPFLVVAIIVFLGVITLIL